jgi:hypothetical protein
MKAKIKTESRCVNCGTPIHRANSTKPWVHMFRGCADVTFFGTNAEPEDDE